MMSEERFGAVDDGYVYDVFLSYRREGAPYTWVKDYLLPLIADWLPESLPYRPHIFVDERSILVGTQWEDELAHALKRSICLLAVWSPEYFRSPYCVAEWESMRVRERLLGLRPGQRRLILPVKFADGQWFPEPAQATRQIDLSPWAMPYAQFKAAPEYLTFV